MAAPTFKSALNNYGRTEADREHLKRWGEHERDPVWEQIAADAKRYGELPPDVDAPYSLFIGAALSARQFAEGRVVSAALQRKRNQQRAQNERSDLLKLAGKIDDMLCHYRACRKAGRLVRVPSPRGPLTEELVAQLSLDWLGREAPRLRQLAEKVSAGEPEWEGDRVPVRASRQSGGKGKRNQSRKLGVFMRRMVNYMYQWCGKPRYDAVAMITNITFPDADVDEENVRSACRPTTRAGRRRSGALSPMK